MLGGLSDPNPDFLILMGGGAPCGGRRRVGGCLVALERRGRFLALHVDAQKSCISEIHLGPSRLIVFEIRNFLFIHHFYINWTSTKKIINLHGNKKNLDLILFKYHFFKLANVLHHCNIYFIFCN